jgi:hypothetical protein
MLEAIERIEQISGKKLDWRYVEEARKGDHICYISNLGKFKKDYPSWKITRGLDTILEEIIASQRVQLARPAGRTLRKSRLRQLAEGISYVPNRPLVPTSGNELPNQETES